MAAPTGQLIGAVAEQMSLRLAELPPDRAHRAPFLNVYRRTTLAVQDEVANAGFEDPEWVERWDVVFADLYFAAHDADLAGGPVSRPWRLAFDASAGQPPLRQVLLGINAHVNYDLPQALLAVVGPQEFEQPTVLARRRRDHERIDAVLGQRVGAEDRRLRDTDVRTTVLDRLLAPLNRRASRRFLAESRRKVWHNTEQLNQARLAGRYEQRLAELEILAAGKVADLLEPGQVLLKLAAGGFGVVLPPE